ncbi:MAG: O-antigen export system, permease protein, partial [uncultured Nocardioidaceae bacterium]
DRHGAGPAHRSAAVGPDAARPPRSARPGAPRPVVALDPPGARLLLHLARHQGALPTDGAGWTLGGHPAVGHDGGVLGDLRQGGGDLLRRAAVSGVLLRRPPALDPLRHRRPAGQQQPGEQPEPAPEGLLPPTLAPGGSRGRRSGRPGLRQRGARRHDGDLRRRTGTHSLPRAAVAAAGGGRLPGGGGVVRGAERPIPRRQVRRAVRAPGLVVPDAGRLSEQPHRPAVADAVGAEPDGRRGGGDQVGTARRRHRARPAHPRLGGHGDRRPRRWAVLLPPRRGHLRGRGV